MKVTKYTRASKTGLDLACPHCQGTNRVYHLSWDALGCIACKEMVDKYDWDIANRRCSKCDSPLKAYDSAVNPGKTIWLHTSLKPCVRVSRWK